MFPCFDSVSPVFIASLCLYALNSVSQSFPALLCAMSVWSPKITFYWLPLILISKCPGLAIAGNREAGSVGLLFPVLSPGRSEAVLSSPQVLLFRGALILDLSLSHLTPVKAPRLAMYLSAAVNLRVLSLYLWISFFSNISRPVLLVKCLPSNQWAYIIFSWLVPDQYIHSFTQLHLTLPAELDWILV